MLLDTGASKISYQTSGSNKSNPIVFIHGFPFDKSMWGEQVGLLSGDHFVVSFDMRGHGESDPASGHYLIEFFVDDLLALMDHLGLRQVCVCGLSMGGYTALRAIDREPARFSGLILCDTKATPDTNAAKLSRSNQIKTLLGGKNIEFADAQLKALFAPGSLSGRKEAVDKIRKMIESTSDTALIGTLIALAARMDMSDSLQKISVPTLIIVGEEDKVTTISDAEFMRSRIANSRLVVIRGAGHLTNLENPAEFNSAVTEFLAEKGL